MFLSTGLRFSEIAALRWSDVDFAHARLQVNTTLSREGNRGYSLDPTAKSEASEGRVIPLPPIALEALHNQRQVVRDLRRLARRWVELDLVFPSAVGTPIRENKTIERFQAICESLGLPSYTLHQMRHTYATQLFAIGTHPRAVQELMGHSDVSMTLNRYTGSVPSVLRDAADGLEAVLRA